MDPEKPGKDAEDRISAALTRHKLGQDPLHPERPLSAPAELQAQAQAIPGGPVKRPDGVVAQYRANSITRKAALQQLTEYYGAELEVVKARLKEVVRVRKAEAALRGEEFLAALNHQHLEFLTELGLRNEALRNNAMMKLNAQTDEALRKVAGSDWQPAMVDTTLDLITKRYMAFMTKLANDLEERP